MDSQTTSHGQHRTLESNLKNIALNVNPEDPTEDARSQFKTGLGECLPVSTTTPPTPRPLNPMQELRKRRKAAKQAKDAKPRKKRRIKKTVEQTSSPRPH